MAVRIELSLLLRGHVPDYDDEKGLLVENGEGKSITELMEDLGIPSDKVFTILVNRFPSKAGYVVKDGDLVTLARILGAG